MEKRGKKMPYEVVIQERKRVDLYGNVVYYKHVTERDGIGFLIISNTSRPYVILKKLDMM